MKKAALWIMTGILALLLIGCSAAGPRGEGAEPGDSPAAGDIAGNSETGDEPTTENGESNAPEGAGEPGAEPAETGEDGGEDAEAAESGSFRITSPAGGATIRSPLVIEGEARVSEGAFRVTLEDGHDILAELDAQVDQGAPDWAPFALELPFKRATNPFGMLVLSVQNAKDGSWEEELMIPVKFEEVDLGGTP